MTDINMNMKRIPWCLGAMVAAWKWALISLFNKLVVMVAHEKG